MKPSGIFAFIISAGILLIIFSLVFPEKGIPLFGYTILQYPSFSELTGSFRTNPENKTKQIVESIIFSTIKNNRKILENETEADSSKQEIDFDPEKIHSFEFPKGNENALHSFFASLQQADKTRIRVMHYGDSQIEGDRITSYLRYQLQKKFGGGGPGLVPVVQPYPQFSVKHRLSGEWKRYTVISENEKSKFHKRYGVLMSFNRFAPEDSACTDTTQTVEASVQFSIPPKAFSNNKKFNLMRVFYSNQNAKVSYSVFADERITDFGWLEKSELLDVLSFQFGSVPQKVELRLKGNGSPDIFAVALDMDYGVCVDNIPLRGSSGILFTTTDNLLLQAMYDKLNVKLFILQFGGNTVPYIKSTKQCISYGKWFYAQLMRLKKFKPSASIIVIGPSDMAYKEKDEYVTYPLLDTIRTELKKNTLQAGGVFWDMYEAMGGKNSMNYWVQYDPPLATTDYTHFTPKGANIISKMFYAALMKEYEKYLKKEK